MLVFEEKGEPEDLEMNLSEQGREPTTNLLNPHMTQSTNFQIKLELTLVFEERG